MIQFTINHTTNESLDKIVAMQILGVMTALKEGLITIEEAEKVIFSPRHMDLFKANGGSEELLNLIHLGTELEDVESVIPHELEASIEEIYVLCIRFLKKRTECKIEEHVFKPSE
ncbi:DUF3969 family protein [Bacillus sp. 179-C3.3 HS]|uniref:DUF3969 family protein n=1 Tax=Bacillus sp. 179-C3.3 HS TaxID=3232162 RepID=UPI0039A3DD7F